MAYGKILQHALQAGRNLGQAGKNYGRIARDRGADLLRSNPEYAIGAGLTGVVGGSLAHSMSESSNDSKKRQYEGWRELIKNETNGLGGLVYNKKKNEYVVTYAGTPQELKDNKHFSALKYIIDRSNKELDIKLRESINGLSPKQSKIQQDYIEKMMSTPEGAEKLQNYIASKQKNLENPYSEDYGNPYTKDLPSGDTMGTGDFR